MGRESCGTLREDYPRDRRMFHHIFPGAVYLPREWRHARMEADLGSSPDENFRHARCPGSVRACFGQWGCIPSAVAEQAFHYSIDDVGNQRHTADTPAVDHIGDGDDVNVRVHDSW